MIQTTFLMLSRRTESPWFGWPYEAAFERAGIDLFYIPEGIPADSDIDALLALCPQRPSLIIRPECTRFPLPPGLTRVDIPTAAENEDVYAYTGRRISWSMLFDYPLLYHAGFAEQFRAAGHPRPIEMPQALKQGLFPGGEKGREFEVGWIGQMEGPLYSIRRIILPELARQFVMNDWQRRHTQAEMVEVYSRSKVVVNVGRDDYPQDANRRVFEAMGAGAMLLVHLPTELTEMGLVEGVHFVGYRDAADLVPCVRKYLQNETARRAIAEAGRAEVLRNHTYDARANKLLQALRRDSGRLWAPARNWPEHRVRLTYLDYYAANGPLNSAQREWPRVARQSMSGAVRGAALIAGAWSRRWR